MQLNDTLLTIIRILTIILLCVFIYTAVQTAMFVTTVKDHMEAKITSGEFFSDVLNQVIDEKPSNQSSG
jgi:hypothetical protein